MTFLRITSFTLTVVLCFSSVIADAYGWRDNYNKLSCPTAEAVMVQLEYANFTEADQFALLRNAFHDCHLDGCDASVLLDEPNTEKTAEGNFLTGFEISDKERAQLKAVCPGVVSCPDILAWAALEAVLDVRRYADEIEQRFTP